MSHEMRTPKEGELHCVTTVGGYTFELRYGFNQESERLCGEPFVLYPDLAASPIYAPEGYRIVSAIQSVCPYYLPAPGAEPEDCCYTCGYYPDQIAEIGICSCEEMRRENQEEAVP